MCMPEFAFVTLVSACIYVGGMCMPEFEFVTLVSAER